MFEAQCIHISPFTPPKNKLDNGRTDVNDPRKASVMHSPTPDPVPIDVIG
jgi:hypothetical protein